MAGLLRFIQILRLFDERHCEWTIPDMAARISVPASTVYRTVRELVRSGMLVPSTEALYRLGPAIIEFDRRLRITDPLIREGVPVLQDLVASIRLPCIALLAQLYGDQVICIADEVAPNSEITTSYERGRPMPLFRGATSKAIMALLPRDRLRKIAGKATQEHPVPPFAELTADLSAIKKRGFSITRGEVDTGLVGLSVPVFCPQRAIYASMSLILKASDLDEGIERRLMMTLAPAANMLIDKLAPSSAETTFPRSLIPS